MEVRVDVSERRDHALNMFCLLLNAERVSREVELSAIARDKIGEGAHARQLRRRPVGRGRVSGTLAVRRRGRFETLPQRQLLEREDVPMAVGQVSLLNPNGGVVGIVIEETEGLLGLKWQIAGRGSRHHVATAIAENLQLWLAGEWLLVGTNDDPGQELRWLLLATGAECVRVRWPDDSTPILRSHSDEWTIFDARGRVLSFNTSSGAQQAFSLR